MKITKIIKRNVEIDGIYEIMLTYHILNKYSLKIGLDISREYKYIVKDIILYKVLYILNNSFKTKKEILDKIYSEFVEIVPKELENRRILHKKIIDKIIEYCEKKRYIDDYSYAKIFIENKKQNSLLKNKILLKQKGIPSEILNELLVDMNYELVERDIQNIEYILCKYDYKDLKDNKQKIFSKLINKGYKYENIRVAYNKIIERDI